MQAYYGASPEGHFGLGFKDYTHFTSPIRRYPDLVVHRCLKSLMDGSKPPYELDELIFIGIKAQRWSACPVGGARFRQDQVVPAHEGTVGEIFQAMVSGVSKFRFFRDPSRHAH